MRKEILPIAFMTPGSSAHVSALHFGDESLPKIYIQSSLHADELPGSLAAYYLHKTLLQLEQEGKLRAHIVLVPFCNPLGLNQSIAYMHIGRFHLPTGQNFNRLFNLPVKQTVLGLLEQDPPEFSENPKQNTKILRSVIARALAQIKPGNNLQSMHLHLLMLAHDADIVLDLHCDNTSVLHMYTMPSTWSIFEPLARYLGSQCQLISTDSKASSFDEIFSTLWYDFIKLYPHQSIEQGLASSTVELRGEHDLSHNYGQMDANAIVQFLHLRGYIALEESQALPELLNPPHPLEGLFYVPAPCSGITVYLAQPGEWVEEGQTVAEILDPFELTSTPVVSPHRGFIFAHSGTRLAVGELKLMSISCPVSIGNDGLSP